nr:MAG TPA: hypothetical protein [Bacteriophage sp.]
MVKILPTFCHTPARIVIYYYVVRCCSSSRGILIRSMAMGGRSNVVLRFRLLGG